MEATKSNHYASKRDTFEVAPRIWGLKTIFVNMFFIAEPDGSWVLVDTGVPGFAAKIKRAAAALFGEGARPRAILLTHGHFDHSGNVKELARHWDVPVYAHPMEFPYLTGLSSYPPPDASVGGGGMAYMAFTYPKQPIDIKPYLELLPDDGSVPGLAGWHWLHTPGHTPGHVSFFREEDRVLVLGDAFATRDAASAFALITEKRKVHGPPTFLTSDWAAAHHSVETLSNLNPQVAAAGHGMPMVGDELRRQLDDLVKNFWVVAVPRTGRYVHAPAVADERGVISVPPSVDTSMPKILAAAGALALAGLALTAMRKRRKVKDSAGHISGNRPYSHNRVAPGLPPTVDPDHDDPNEHTNNYP
ncbi:MBL fold metallo-hydrolase [Pontibacter sp. E15-1]|uniref:MBL fold metallo-hydrolase n=1 Tax=Pontibacter sp. E15-1 TaxID=2919918 RepID=UPI001F4FD801|nr:MBL fold metallo-hydrolase [Pontibacter sp. E15-1]MCJ8164650.1 MBL fold metallo-hydrolase [Pontibacter sp. E15-1]